MVISVLQYYPPIFYLAYFTPVPDSSEIDVASDISLLAMFRSNCLICVHSDAKQEKDIGPVSITADFSLGSPFPENIQPFCQNELLFCFFPTCPM